MFVRFIHLIIHQIFLEPGSTTNTERGYYPSSKYGGSVVGQVCSQRSTINDQRSTINDQRSTINDQRSTINDQRHTRSHGSISDDNAEFAPHQVGAQWGQTGHRRTRGRSVGPRREGTGAATDPAAGPGRSSAPAQRLGRILRPKQDGRQAHFYSVVARDTNDQEFAAKRQRFLAEQGYAYRIIDAEDLLGSVTPL
jgi:hypothetical protein